MSLSRTRLWIAAATGALLLVLALMLLPADWLAPRDTAIEPVAFAQPASAAAVATVPPPPDLPPERVALGEHLFHDTRLSGDQTLACAGCHDLGRGGVDRLPVSIGVGAAKGGINAPTVFNAGLNFVQFWDGRAATLEEQAAGPIHSELEMSSDWARILPRLRADGEYVRAFATAYPDGITAANVLDAIASFERTLVTPNSRFDRYLNGELAVLTADELAGYQRFRDYGCTSCHQGRLLGANMYQKFGAVRDYYQNRPTTKADLGRYNVTGRDEDRHVFKVPSLRNVAVTAPYFHDASAATLEQAVVVMGRHQLGRDLGSRDVTQIVAFLRTLTGEWRGKVLE
jgi:cytochrome c peroxidase